MEKIGTAIESFRVDTHHVMNAQVILSGCCETQGMKRLPPSPFFLVPTVLMLGLLLAPNVEAQTVSSTSVTVSARIVGTFEVSVSGENFDFGDLDANGLSLGTPNIASKGRNSEDIGVVYESMAGSLSWTAKASPASSVDIALISTEADHTGGMYVDGLEVRIPSTNGGKSTGFQSFTSQANLINAIPVGNGVDTVAGDLDLRLNVLDSDPIGTNTWVVRLRATANP